MFAGSHFEVDKQVSCKSLATCSFQDVHLQFIFGIIIRVPRAGVPARLSTFVWESRGAAEEKFHNKTERLFAASAPTSLCFYKSYILVVVSLC